MANTYNAKKYDTNNISNTTQVNNVEKDTSNTAQVINTNSVEAKTGATQSQNAIANGNNTNGINRIIGSLGTTNNNTNTTGSAVGSPATTTPQNVSLPADPVQDFITNFSNAVNNQDLSGQISALTQLDEYNVSQGGQPMFSDVIGNLKSKNSEQVINTVNDYGTQLYEAVRAGNKDLANGLMAELGEYKEKNNYQNVLNDMQVQLNNEYSFTYMQGINDITNGILNLVNKYSNFQYNPANDMALQMAQGYAVSAVKEQMNATGMYYSSITQNAITRAINELVPVYEQMAKEELMNNINLLQSTASYLMNLEKSQFDMWASQIELQFRANEDRRQEIELAWDRTNKLGYVDNEASLVLGLEVGTLSPDARNAILQEQADIRAEQRKLQNSMVLAEYTNLLDMEKASKQLELDKEKISWQTNEDIREKVEVANNTSSGNLTTSDLKAYIEGLSNENVNKSTLLYETLVSAKNEDVAKNVIANAENDEGKIFNSKLATEIGIPIYMEILKLEENYDNESDVVNDMSNILKSVQSKVDNNELTNEQAIMMIAGLGEDTIGKIIEENSKNYSSTALKTKDAIKKTTSSIEDFSLALLESKLPYTEQTVIGTYEELFDKIGESKDEFDYSMAPFNQGKKGKAQAIKAIIDEIENKSLYKNKNQIIVSTLRQYAKDMADRELIESSVLN